MPDRDSLPQKKIDIRKYLIIRHSDTTYIDTTLTYRKELAFNILEKDLWEYRSFHNMGQPYQRIGYDFGKAGLLPGMGFTAKHQSYIHPEDVRYYRVPTPTSRLFFKTGIQQGQYLHSFLTANLTPRVNFSIDYRGLRSLGLYRHSLASKENFTLAGDYQARKGYSLRFHYVSHNYMNEENGGLDDTSLGYYLSGNPDYLDRGRIETRYTDAESTLKARRVFIENAYDFFADSLRSYKRLQIGHRLIYEREYYLFNQDHTYDFIGDAFVDQTADSTAYRHWSQSVFARAKIPHIPGQWEGEARYWHYLFGNKAQVFIDGQHIPPVLSGSAGLISASWKNSHRAWSWDLSAGYSTGEDVQGNYLQFATGYAFSDKWAVKGKLLLSSRSPDFIFKRYQSNYIAYNWLKDLEPENTRVIGGQIEAGTMGDAGIQVGQKNNYTYFDTESMPAQYPEALAYMKVYAHRDFHYRKFTFDLRGQYQHVSAGQDVLHLPEWMGETALYFSDYVFRGDPMFLQTGVRVKYFTPYYADAFNPLINEFYLQDQRRIGGKPQIDIFANAKVLTMRLYLKAENIGALWGERLLSAPDRPYRDFAVRFGLVWNFFQ